MRDRFTFAVLPVPAAAATAKAKPNSVECSADGWLNPEMLANGGFGWRQTDHRDNPGAWKVRI